MQVITNPSAENIRQAIAAFDSENKIIEEALRELFAGYPGNSDPREVLLKVTALNTLYSTQIPLYNNRLPTILDIVANIVEGDIDSRLQEGHEGAVSHIATTKVPSKEPRYYYSFATKYCSWHNPSAYPIFDSRVVAYLWYLRKHGCTGKFHKGDLWKYSKFKAIIEEFQKRNDLNGFSFKDVDKFLYFQGSALLNGRPERKVETDGTILEPVPGQPDEMEWSVENYSSPEEAEQSRKKFTDSSSWNVVEPSSEK